MVCVTSETLSLIWGMQSDRDLTVSQIARDVARLCSVNAKIKVDLCFSINSRTFRTDLSFHGDNDFFRKVNLTFFVLPSF
jgi:hypothetical protein